MDKSRIFVLIARERDPSNAFKYIVMITNKAKRGDLLNRETFKSHLVIILYVKFYTTSRESRRW